MVVYRGLAVDKGWLNSESWLKIEKSSSSCPLFFGSVLYPFFPSLTHFLFPSSVSTIFFYTFHFLSFLGGSTKISNKKLKKQFEKLTM